MCLSATALLTRLIASADAQLLIAIIAEQSVTLNFDAVASRLGCTPRAVQERLKKLKKLAAGQVDGAPPITPSKRASKKTDEDSLTSKKRKIATPRAPKTLKSKVPLVKEEQEAVVSGEESLAEDSAFNTQAGIDTEYEEEEVFTGGEADLGENTPWRIPRYLPSRHANFSISATDLV